MGPPENYLPYYMESPFVNRLKRLVGKNIRVSSYCGEKCEGVLKAVYSDYIVLVDKEITRDIRIEALCCAAEIK